MAEPIAAPTVVPLNPALTQAVTEDVAAENDQIHPALEQDPTIGQSPGSAVNQDAQAIPAVPRQPDAQPQAGQKPFTCEIFGSAARMVAGFP